MRGGYTSVTREELEKIHNSVEELGYELASKHQTSKDWTSTEEEFTDTQIHDRDYNWLIESDLGVFEISNPSHGVGGEISDMIHLGKPVLCLLKRGLEKVVSSYVQGKQGSRYITSPFECSAYETVEDAKKQIKEFVEEQSK